MSKLVYLDNNDFSDLSRSEDKLSQPDSNILALLRKLKQSGTRFFLSPILLSEAVHASMDHKEFALQRAKLMRELCQHDFLIYPTDICELEIQKLLTGLSARLTLDEITSKKDCWFGIAATDVAASAKKDARGKIDKYLDALPRKTRRKMRSVLNLSKTSSHEHWREIIKSGDAFSSSSLPPPLSAISKDTVIDWFLGIKTDAEFRHEMMTVLNNPYILFSFVLDETGHRDTLYKIAHKPGSDWQISLTKICEGIASITALAEKIGTPLEAQTIVTQWFKTSNAKTQLVTSLAGKNGGHIDPVTTESILKNCPAVSTLVSALREYIFKLVDSQIQKVRAGKNSLAAIEPSTFGDLMHCVYAPYMDAFRCDAPFGALLKKNSAIKSRIFDRRADLLSFISSQAA